MDKTEVYRRIEKHYRENRDRFVKLFVRSTGSYHRAEDVVQEGYSRALQYWNSFPDGDKDAMDKYMRRIFSNCSNDIMRSELNHGMNDKISGDEPTVSCNGYATVVLEQLKREIFSKPEEHARVIYLIAFDQWAPSQVSTYTGMSEGNVRQITFRFRQEMKDKFNWNL